MVDAPVILDGATDAAERELDIAQMPAMRRRAGERQLRVIGARGTATALRVRAAADGLGAPMGARTVVPPGATGRPGSDLGAERTAVPAPPQAGAGRAVVPRAVWRAG